MTWDYGSKCCTFPYKKEGNFGEGLWWDHAPIVSRSFSSRSRIGSALEWTGAQMAGFQTYGFVFFGPSWNFERTILQSWLDRMILGSAAHGGGPLMFFCGDT